MLSKIRRETVLDIVYNGIFLLVLYILQVGVLCSTNMDEVSLAGSVVQTSHILVSCDPWNLSFPVLGQWFVL